MGGKGGAQETSVKVRRQTARPWAPHEGETRALKPEAGSARGAGKAGGPHESEAGFKRGSSGQQGFLCKLESGRNARTHCVSQASVQGRRPHTHVCTSLPCQRRVWVHTRTRVRASWVHLRAQT